MTFRPFQLEFTEGDEFERWQITEKGSVLQGVHLRGACKPPCPLHHPTDHEYLDWELVWEGGSSFSRRDPTSGDLRPDPDSHDLGGTHSTGDDDDPDVVIGWQAYVEAALDAANRLYEELDYEISGAGHPDDVVDKLERVQAAVDRVCFTLGEVADKGLDFSLADFRLISVTASPADAPVTAGDPFSVEWTDAPSETEGDTESAKGGKHRARKRR